MRKSRIKFHAPWLRGSSCVQMNSRALPEHRRYRQHGVVDAERLVGMYIEVYRLRPFHIVSAIVLASPFGVLQFWWAGTIQGLGGLPTSLSKNFLTILQLLAPQVFGQSVCGCTLQSPCYC